MKDNHNPIKLVIARLNLEGLSAKELANWCTIDLWYQVALFMAQLFNVAYRRGQSHVGGSEKVASNKVAATWGLGKEIPRKKQNQKIRSLHKTTNEVSGGRTHVQEVSSGQQMGIRLTSEAGQLHTCYLANQSHSD